MSCFKLWRIFSILIRIPLMSSRKTRAPQPEALSRDFYWNLNSAFSESTYYKCHIQKLLWWTCFSDDMKFPNNSRSPMTILRKLWVKMTPLGRLVWNLVFKVQVAMFLKANCNKTPLLFRAFQNSQTIPGSPGFLSVCVSWRIHVRQKENIRFHKVEFSADHQFLFWFFK